MDFFNFQIKKAECSYCGSNVISQPPKDIQMRRDIT